MESPRQPHAGIGGNLEEAGKRLLFRVYEWWKNTAADAEKLENELATAMLSAFEESIKKLVRWEGGTISELTESIRLRVEGGIGEAESQIMSEVDAGYAILKDSDKCDRDLRRCELAARYVRQKTQAKIRAIWENWADAALSYVLRKAEEAEAGKASAIAKSNDAEAESAALEARLARLNATLREAIAKFIGNRKSLLSRIQEVEAAAEASDNLRKIAEDERDVAKNDRDSAIRLRIVAENERDAAKSETATAKALYARVSKKAAEADKVADLLRGYWKSWKSPVEELGEILNELRRTTSEASALKSQNDALRWEKTTYQRTTMRNYQLEKRLSELNATLSALENQVRHEMAARIEAEEAVEAVTWENPRIEEELRFAAWAYFAVMLRMEGSDPEAQDYSDYERIERELEKWMKFAQSKWMDAFSISENAAASAKDEWTSNKELLRKIGVTKLTAQATYEKCVREFWRKAVPNSVRDVVEKLRIYTDVAWITWSRSKRETIVDVEYR